MKKRGSGDPQFSHPNSGISRLFIEHRKAIRKQELLSSLVQNPFICEVHLGLIAKACESML